jgi:fatty-acyl-CoA synthase
LSDKRRRAASAKPKREGLREAQSTRGWPDRARDPDIACSSGRFFLRFSQPVWAQFEWCIRVDAPQESASRISIVALMSLIPACVKRHAEAQPTALFCTVLSGRTVAQITYEDFYAAGCAYAREYMRLGIRPGDVVLIILQHSPHLFYSFLGAMLAGAIPSFMPFPSVKQRADLYWDDHEALFARLRPRLIVSYASNIAAARATLEKFAVDSVLADDSLLNRSYGEDACYPGLSVAPDDIACLQHSSGTTGLKKGVMLSHRVILEHVAAYGRALDFSPLDSIVSWLPLYHDMGFIACFMMALVRGTHLIALDPFEWSVRPQILLDAIMAYRPTFCWLPNFAFSHLVRATKQTASVDLRSIRAFINCSEPCKAATLDRFLERFAANGVHRAQLAVCYAMAENVFAVTQTTLGREFVTLEVDADALGRGLVGVPQPGFPAQTLVSCGEPIDGVTIRICEASGDEIAAGGLGEVNVSGDSLFAGYYAQPDITRQRVRNGWYATGDMGFLHEGLLYVTGRVDDMIFVNGRNYYAHEIESLVGTIPGVLPGRIAAIGVADPDTDANGIVVLAEADGLAVDTGGVSRDVRVAVLERLGLAIARVVLLQNGSLVKTTSGKISRVKNKQMYVDDLFAEYSVTR